MIDSWVTLAIAICGLAVAAATAGWNIYRDGFRDRARLRLNLSRGYFGKWAGVPPQPGLPPPGEPVVFVNAVNVGRRPVIIAGGGGVEFPADVRAMFTAPPPELRKRLEEGDDVTLYTTEDSFRELIQEHGVPTHIWFRDTADKTHRKPIPRELRPWLKALGKGGKGSAKPLG